MKVGLIGSGGREHALAKVLIQNNQRDQLFVFASTSNPGIERVSTQYKVGSLSDIDGILSFFESISIDAVIVGPEAPLIAGVVDALRQKGIPTVGPNQSQARLEGSKAFMRDLMQRRVGWGIPKWAYVRSESEARQFIDEVGQVVIKPVGLTGGKGVQVMGVHLHTIADVVAEAKTWIDADGGVLLEERLIGEEFSRMAFISDGVFAPLPVAQDFKYAYDGDTGGMTGGMGSYTMADGSMPFINSNDLDDADRLMREVVFALEEETGERYRGILYGQFMATKNGLCIIEFNVRFGDPESINELALLESDAPLLFEAIAKGNLANNPPVFAQKASLCKYLVPADYPGKKNDTTIFGLDEKMVNDAGFSVVFSSITSEGDKWRTLGSRTLAIVGLGDNPGEISERMEELLTTIEPTTLRHRKDVGSAITIQAKIERMAKIR
jgi:phosphoribosylamine--glycine ligase